jgi:hypothetical protein
MNPIPNGDVYLEPLNMVEAGTVDKDTKALAKEIYTIIQNKTA